MATSAGIRWELDRKSGNRHGAVLYREMVVKVKVDSKVDVYLGND